MKNEASKNWFPETLLVYHSARLTSVFISVNFGSPPVKG